MELKIRRLSPELAEDFLYFFDEVAFSDHPEWSPCYCLESHLDSSQDRGLEGAARRSKAEEMVRSALMQGYLAYDGERPVGWCNADRREAYPDIAADSRRLNQSRNEKIKAVYCFLIAPEMRKKGVASALLQRVVEDAQKEGYDAVEGYPQTLKSGAPEWTAYHGPEELYRQCGFRRLSVQERIIMRRELQINRTVIGITGSIASGKSTVSRYLEERYGVRRIDADQVAHEVLREADVVLELTNAFGKDILDEAGGVDRSRLGSIVFSDPGALTRLNRLTHPRVCQKIEQDVQAYRTAPGQAPFLILEAIELLRTPLKSLTDQIWVVWAEDKVRVRRVMERQHLSEEEAWARVRGQWPQENYKAAADVLIDGGGSVETLRRRLDQLWAQIEERKTALAIS